MNKELEALKVHAKAEGMPPDKGPSVQQDTVTVAFQRKSGQETNYCSAVPPPTSWTHNNVN